MKVTRLTLAILAIYCTAAWQLISQLLPYYNLDARVGSWFLVNSWRPILLIISTYFLITVTGPKLMGHRPAFELSTVLKIYNLAQVLLSVYMVHEFAVAAWKSDYRLLCEPVDYSDSKLALRMASVVWWYFFSKIMDLFDTVFFILRKKNSQISFLHVYHHASMILNCWLTVKYVAGGQTFFPCALNSAVHVVMYSYYFLSTFGPKVQKYLWWKRHLTQLQIIQFCVCVVYSTVSLFSCSDFPRGVTFNGLLYAVTLLALFTDFYKNEYRVGVSRIRDPEKSQPDPLHSSGFTSSPRL